MSADAKYEQLLTLWTSRVKRYHTQLCDYLTANDIVVAVIGLLVSRESLSLPSTILLLIVPLIDFGILLCFQVAIVLGRLSGQNVLREWQSPDI